MAQEEVINEIIALDDAKYHLGKYIIEYGKGHELLKTFDYIEKLLIRYDLNYNDFLKVLTENSRIESPEFLIRAISREIKLKTALAYNIERKRLGRKNKVKEFAEYIERAKDPDFYTKYEIKLFGYSSPEEATKQMVARKLEEAKKSMSRTSYHRLLKQIKGSDTIDSVWSCSPK